MIEVYFIVGFIIITRAYYRMFADKDREYLISSLRNPYCWLGYTSCVIFWPALIMAYVIINISIMIRNRKK